MYENLLVVEIKTYKLIMKGFRYISDLCHTWEGPAILCAVPHSLQGLVS